MSLETKSNEVKVIMLPEEVEVIRRKEEIEQEILRMEKENEINIAFEKHQFDKALEIIQELNQTYKYDPPRELKIRAYEQLGNISVNKKADWINYFQLESSLDSNLQEKEQSKKNMIELIKKMASDDNYSLLEKSCKDRYISSSILEEILIQFLYEQKFAEAKKIKEVMNMPEQRFVSLKFKIDQHLMSKNKPL